MFERLLRRQLERVLVGAVVLGGACAGGESGSENCENVTESSQNDGDLSREPGYLVLAEGESCPEEPDISQLQGGSCCPAVEAKESCGLTNEEVTSDMPFYTYGYGDTGPDEVVTLCTYDAVFEVGNSCCGRPMFVDGTEVVAAVCATPQDWVWATDPLPVTAEVAEAGRAYWLRVAQLEHASVASFGRVALELLRHGAPADLVARCHEAALDEVRHAQLAFGLASALGSPAGPGPLPLGGSVALSGSLADVAEALVREGCIGETLAALDAAARLRRAQGEVAEALAIIADDEARHASLAWATLRWLVEAGGQEVVDRAEAVFAAGPTPMDGPMVPGGRAVGLLPASEVAAAQADAWQRVVMPAWRALRDGGAVAAVKAPEARPIG